MELERAPSLPEYAAHLWEYYCQLSRQRRNNAYELSPLYWSDIAAWINVRNIRLDRWELDTLLSLDGAFMTRDKFRPEEVEGDGN